jgi:hypothetical protein
MLPLISACPAIYDTTNDSLVLWKAIDSSAISR